MEQFEIIQAREKLQSQRIEKMLEVFLDFKQPPENFKKAMAGFFAQDKDRVAKEFSRIAQYDSGEVKGNWCENIANHIASDDGVTYAGLLSNAFTWANKLAADYDDLLQEVDKLFNALTEFYDWATDRTTESKGANWESLRWMYIDAAARVIPNLKERMVDECDLAFDVMFYYERYKHKMTDQSLVREHNGNHYYGDAYSTRFLPEDDCKTLYKLQERAAERFVKLIITERPIVKERIAAVRLLVPEWNHLVGTQFREIEALKR